MKTTRQEYKDSTYEEAVAAGCDMLQLKLDGWWSRCEIIGGLGRVYSETGRYLPRFDFVTHGPDATIIGELMYGTHWAKDPQRYGKIFLFDIWRLKDVDLEDKTYKDRNLLVRCYMTNLSPDFQLIQNYRIVDYPPVWQTFVESKQYEGVVFRRSTDLVGATILREKYSFQVDLQVVGFREGEGKHSGRLGALLCADENRIPTDIGGGLSDADRIDIWTHQDDYFQRYCQVEARKRFDSGSLRHANFVAWRPEGWKP